MSNIYVRSTDGSDADNGSTWALAKATLAGALAIATIADVIWLSQVHAETQATAQTLTCPTTPGLQILCGNDGAQPPTALATTAKITNTGNVAVALDGCYALFGLQIIAGSGSSGSTCRVALGNAATTHAQYLDSCKLECRSTGAAAPGITLGTGASSAMKDVRIELVNSSFRLGATGQSITLQGARVIITTCIIDGSSSIPTTLFKFVAGCNCDCVIRASDWTGQTWTNFVNVSAACSSSLDAYNCTFPTSFVATTGTYANPGGPVVRLHGCDFGDTRVAFTESSYLGTVTPDTIYLTAGSVDDDGNHFSWKMVSSANTKFYAPLKSPPIAIAVTATGSALNAALEALINSVTTLFDDDVWIEFSAYTSSNVTLGTIYTDRMANSLSTHAAQTAGAGTGAWTGAGSPTSYKLDAAFTPQEKGYLIARVCLSKPSTTIYVNSALTVA